MLKKRETAPDDLENHWPIQTTWSGISVLQPIFTYTFGAEWSQQFTRSLAILSVLVCSEKHGYKCFSSVSVVAAMTIF